MKVPVTFLAEANQPSIVWQPAFWNGAWGIGPILCFVDEVMSLKRSSFSRTTSLTLATCPGKDGFAGLFPYFCLEKVVVFLAHGVFMPLAIKNPQ
jgi:hypothetical protein